MGCHIPCDASWGWRKNGNYFLELARHLQKHRIEQGGDVFVLLDNSRTDGPLFPKYGFRVVYDTGSNINFQISSVLSDQ